MYREEDIVHDNDNDNNDDNNPPVLPSIPLRLGEEDIEAAAAVLALPLW